MNNPVHISHQLRPNRSDFNSDVAHQNAVAAWGLAHKHSAAQNRRVKFDYKTQLAFAEDLIWIILTVMFATLGKDFCLVMIIEYGYPRFTKVGEPLSEEKASWLCALLSIDGEKLSELVDNFLGRDGNEKFSGPARTRRDLSHSSMKRTWEAVGDDLVPFMSARKRRKQKHRAHQFLREHSGEVTPTASMLNLQTGSITSQDTTKTVAILNVVHACGDRFQRNLGSESPESTCVQGGWVV